MPLAWIHALEGGLLIGISATGMLWLNGRVAGISGILAGIIPPPDEDARWRRLFIGGLLAGLLTGVGTRIGGGCTSGHGVCGISRGSVPSLVATMTFMATGVATAVVVHHLLGVAR